MKVIFLLLLVAAAQAKVLVGDSGSIKAPVPYTITSFNNPDALRFTWMPTASPPLNPVIGYKVSMWVQKTKTVIEQVEIDGEIVQIETEKLVPFTGEVPDWEPQSEQSVSATSNSAKFYGIKRGIMYQLRVQAFTTREIGPFSDPMSLMIMHNK